MRWTNTVAEGPEPTGAGPIEAGVSGRGLTPGAARAGRYSSGHARYSAEGPPPPLPFPAAPENALCLPGRPSPRPTCCQTPPPAAAPRVLAQAAPRACAVVGMPSSSPRGRQEPGLCGGSRRAGGALQLSR